MTSNYFTCLIVFGSPFLSFLYHVRFCLPKDDEITRLTQLSELQREEILSVRIFLLIELALVSFTSISTQLCGEIDEFNEINYEAEEQVRWFTNCSTLVSFIHSPLTVDPRPSS